MVDVFMDGIMFENASNVSCTFINQILVKDTMVYLIQI